MARATRRIPDRIRRAQEYRLYLESRYDAAEEACRGVLLNADGERRGVNPRTAWFAGRQGTTRYASDELADWFAAHGPTLTATEWRLAVDPTPDDYANDVDVVIDACGVRHAVDYREAEECAYTVCEVWCDPAVSGVVTDIECPVCSDLLPEVPACVAPVSSVAVLPVALGDVEGSEDVPQVAAGIVGYGVEGEACSECGVVHRGRPVLVSDARGTAPVGVSCAAWRFGVPAVMVRLWAVRGDRATRADCAVSPVSAGIVNSQVIPDSPIRVSHPNHAISNPSIRVSHFYGNCTYATHDTHVTPLSFKRGRCRAERGGRGRVGLRQR